MVALMPTSHFHWCSKAVGAFPELVATSGINQDECILGHPPAAEFLGGFRVHFDRLNNGRWLGLLLRFCGCAKGKNCQQDSQCDVSAHK